MWYIMWYVMRRVRHCELCVGYVIASAAKQSNLNCQSYYVSGWIASLRSQ